MQMHFFSFTLESSSFMFRGSTALPLNVLNPSACGTRQPLFPR
uniref:Uncharacterized protein n=1 Tax=Anopheles albimanus TaxID=7167 RepID=A0A182FY35_ANOAL